MSEDIYRQNKNVIFRQEEDEAIIFNPDNSDIVVINSTGCLIWPLCDGRHTKKEMVDKITGDFKVTAKKAKKDLDIFLSDLQKKNFVEKVK